MLEIRNLTVVRDRRRVLDGVTMSAEPGVLALLGVNGAGKTTLLRSLANIQPFKAEAAVLDGHDFRSRKARSVARSVVGYMPQICGFPRTFSVRDLVTYMAWLRRIPRRDRDAAVIDAIRAADLSDRADARLAKLSGGMQRRAFLAQAIVHRPRVLLLDEPTAGLDPEQRITFRSLIRALPSTTLTILSTHLVEDAAHLASQVAVIDAGRTAFEGTIDQLVERGSGTQPGDSGLEQGFSAVRAGSSSPDGT